MSKIIRNMVDLIKDVFLAPLRAIKYGILWCLYYKTVKQAEDIIANATLIHESIAYQEFKLRNIVATMVNNIQTEFYNKPKNYSLLVKRVNVFFDLLESEQLKDIIPYRLIRKK